MYFTIPSIIYFSTFGTAFLASKIQRKSYLRPLLAALLVISYIPTAVWMVKAYPYANVYFNPLPGRNIKEKYDLDYWALTNVQALRKILEADDRRVIKVSAGSMMPLNISILMLTDAEKSRLNIDTQNSQDSSATSDYVITNFRRKETFYIDRKPPENFEQFYEISIDGEQILLVFKRKKSS